MRIGPAAALFAVLCSLPAAATAQWAGEERDVDGVTHVVNPAQGMLPPLSVELTEMWRLGGHSDAPEEFFGVISDIVADDENNFYVLDMQLSEVRVFDQRGAYVATIGRDGEGPGEFRRPMDLNLMPDGTVGVVQPRPSKMVLLTPSGDPAGDYSITPRGEGFPFLQAASTTGGNIAVLYAMGNPDREAQKFTRTTRLSVFDVAGTELREVIHTVTSSSFSNREYHEKDWFGFDRAWSASREGTIAARTSLTDYQVTVWNADGSVRHVLERDAEPVKRPSERIEAEKMRWGAMLGRWVQDPQFTMLPNEHPVQSVHAREDGTIWVRDAAGTYARAPGELAGFDVFDAEGRYERRLSMRGEFDPTRDGMFLAGNYLLVVTDLVSAQASMMGGIESGLEGEADPMEIVCYRMDLAPIARADK